MTLNALRPSRAPRTQMRGSGVRGNVLTRHCQKPLGRCTRISAHHAASVRQRPDEAVRDRAAVAEHAAARPARGLSHTAHPWARLRRLALRASGLMLVRATRNLHVGRGRSSSRNTLPSRVRRVGRPTQARRQGPGRRRDVTVVLASPARAAYDNSAADTAALTAPGGGGLRRSPLRLCGAARRVDASRAR